MSCNANSQETAPVRIYPAPPGVEITPLYAGGGHLKKADGSEPGSPSISGSCPMSKSKKPCGGSTELSSITSATTGFFSKIGSWFGF